MTEETLVPKAVQAPEETNVEPEVNQEPIVTDVPPEPSDNAERSQLGRRVSEQDAIIQELKGTVSNLQQNLETRPIQDPYMAPPQQTASPQRDPDEAITWGDLDQHQKAQVHRQQQYQSVYGESMTRLGTDLSEGDYNEVLGIALSPQVQQSAGNNEHPATAARLHFATARAIHAETKIKKLSKPQIPLAETTPANLGGPSTTTTDQRPPAAKIPQSVLKDPAVASMITDLRRKGWSDEKIAGSLGSKQEVRGEIDFGTTQISK